MGWKITKTRDGFQWREASQDDHEEMWPGSHILQEWNMQRFCDSDFCRDSANIWKILTRRLPQTVKSKRRVFLYDNSCNMHKHALRRGAKEMLKFKIFTDRHHWENHTGCSESYNCDKYDYLKTVNSQICEQKNRSLRKLSSTLAYWTFQNYQTKVKLFFIIKNLRELCHTQLV